MPQRILHQRVKGWRKPTNAVIVDRTSRYGNPFTVKAALEAGYDLTLEEGHEYCVEAFRNWVSGRDDYWMGPECDARRKRLLDGLRLLRGRDLACTCKPHLACHVDVLLPLANGGEV